MTPSNPKPSWHSLSTTDVASELKTNPTFGLSEAEVRERIALYGSNALREQPRPSFWQQLIAQFQSFVIYILIFAAVFSIFLGDWIEAAAILAIVALNAILGVIQEGRAEEALAALRKLSSPDAIVIRDGQQSIISAGSVVPGDVVVLEAGNFIPADLRVIESVNLKIDEASLTGESVAVDKRADLLVSEDAVLGDRRNMAYMGTTATYGRGKGIIVGTGMQTEIGKIADMIQSTEDRGDTSATASRSAGTDISIGALVICMLVGVVIFIREVASSDSKLVDALTDSIMTAVALAIAAVPEGLPAIVTINLAIGMREMIKRNALIRRLPAVETLGSASAICSDKTGTLTQNQMTAVQLYISDKYIEVTGKGYNPQGQFCHNSNPVEPRDQLYRLLLGGLLASDARLEPTPSNGYRMIGDPTEGAIVVAAAKADIWRPRPKESIRVSTKFRLILHESA